MNHCAHTFNFMQYIWT